MEKQAEYYNPVQRGFFPDPSVIRVEDDYYMVNSSFQYFPAIPISHSRDMIHWSIVGYAITNSEYLDLTDIPDSHGIWAPDISYHEGSFYIFATLRLAGDGTRGNNVLRRQLMVTSPRAEGPYSRPAWLEVDAIDPSHFIDDDGMHYMIISPGVNAVPLSSDCTKPIGDPVCLWGGTGERCPEGPHVQKINGWYYAILAEGGTGYQHGINVARSRNLFGPYEASPYNPVMRQMNPAAPIQRTGHGKIVQASDGSYWMYYLCGRSNGGNYTTIGRETALDPVRFTDDGWFLVNEGRGPSLTQKTPFSSTQSDPFAYSQEYFEDFDKECLPLFWYSVRNPAYGSLSLTECPGSLRIWTNDGQLFERRAKNTMVIREQELSYDASLKLDFYPALDGEQAGLTCYYSTATYIRFSLCYENGRKLQLVINRNHGEELICEIPDIPEQSIYLKVEVRRLTRSYYYSLDGNEWIYVDAVKKCIFLCDEGVPHDPKRHTGTLVGLYASNGGCGSRIHADFDWFHYKNIF